MSMSSFWELERVASTASLLGRFALCVAFMRAFMRCFHCDRSEVQPQPDRRDIGLPWTFCLLPAFASEYARVQPSALFLFHT